MTKINHGLNEYSLNIIRRILTENTPDITNVRLFGSRATGSYTPYSDIDIVLDGNIEETVADRLWTCFTESLLPYKVDINIYKHITYPPLKKHIDRCGKTLFTREQLYAPPQK